MAKDLPASGGAVGDQGLPASGGAVGDQGLPRFQSGAKIPIPAALLKRDLRFATTPLCGISTALQQAAGN